MTTESKPYNPARDEFFSQLETQFEFFVAAQSYVQEQMFKERILGISFDKCEELMKRVEDLLEALESIRRHGIREFEESGARHEDYEFIVNKMGEAIKKAKGL